MKIHFWTVFVFALLLQYGCGNNASTKKTTVDSSEIDSNSVKMQPGDSLPPPFATPSVRNMSKVLGWPEGKMPVAPAGFTVTRFADKLESPRWIYVTDNGDIFVAESNREKQKSANRITLFKDTNKDGIADSRSVFLQGLNQPFGMLIIGNKFYVGNTDAVVMYDYTPGSTSISTAGKTIT